MDDIRKGVCPLCRHNEVIESAIGQLGSEPLSVSGHYGPLMLFTCRRCGFAQMFAKDPEKVPIEEYRQTRLIAGPAPEGPYR
jgi:hypothetical protein